MKDKLISLFKGYADIQPKEVTLEHIVHLIRHDATVRDHTLKHRYYLQQQQSAVATREKAACPCFAVAVRFAGGKRKEHITGWTTLSLADIDDVPEDRMEQMMDLVKADPHTILAYRTISGCGIRVIFCIGNIDKDCNRNPRNYTALFTEANRHYSRLLGVDCDLKCKNVTRLSGLAHDPEAFFNPDAEPFQLQVKTSEENSSSPQSAADRLLKRAVARAVRELEAQDIRYVDHAHNEYIMRMGYLLNAFGVDEDAATRWAIRRFTDYDGDISAIFRSCYQHTDEHGTRRLTSRREAADSEASAFANVHEIEAFLDGIATFRHNVITGKCEMAQPDTDGKPGAFAEIDDRMVNTLWCRMCKEVKPVRINDLRNVLASGYVKLFNPFAEYFNRLKPWDGVTDPIGRLAATVHVRGDQERFAVCFKKWFVGIVASLFDTQVVNHEILVLVGPQGSYKTTWLNNLLPMDLRRYFYVKSNNNRITKDDLFTLTEFALICLEEIDEMRPAEMNQLKAMVTMKSVNERVAYAHYKEHRPHIASFCGTSNNPHFLSDPTGNRRWLPFEVDFIDDPYLNPVAYAEVYAQAYALWKAGFPYWFSSHEVDAINRHNLQFEVPNLEQELVLTHFRIPAPGEKCKFVSTAYILNRINVGIRQTLSPTRIGIAMKQAGFKSVRHKGQRGYRVVELTGEEIQNNQYASGRYTEEP